MADPSGLRHALLALRRGLITQEGLTRAIQEQEKAPDASGLLELLVRNGDLSAEFAETLRSGDGGAATIAGGAGAGQTVADGTLPGVRGAGATIADGTLPGTAPAEVVQTSARLDPVSRTRLGEYLLNRVLGSGGMGVVYEALHEPLKRKVALKVLSPQLAHQEASLQRFYREVRAAARLHHPNIVPVFDVGEEQGTHYFAMEYIEGRTLEQIAQTDGISYEESAAAVKAISEALHYAHGQGIIHRDVKPSNLIRTPDGRVLITDFGVAKELTEAGLTASGALLGTPAYMSPEQAAGSKEPITPRTDVYSLGATLYDLCTGRRPFMADSFEATLAKVLFHDPERPLLSKPDLPLDLDTIILKAMAKEPDRRYPTAQDLAEDLGRFLRGEPILARPMTTVNRVMRRIRRHRIAVTASGIVAVLIAVGGGIVWHMLTEQRAEAARLAAERVAREAEILAEKERLARETAEREAIQKVREESRALVKSGLLMKVPTPQDAMLRFTRALEIDPENWEAWLERGRMHREQGEFREALDDLKRAIALSPDSIDGYAERMTIFLCMNDFLRVAGELDNILKRWPEHRFAKMGKAALLYLKGNKAEAVAEFTKVIEEMPNEALAWAGRGGCLLELDRHQEALNDLDRALQLEPKNIMALNNRAQLFMEAGQLDRAIADAGLSLSSYTSYFWPWEIRGKCRFQKGEFAAAEEDLEQAVKLGPTQADSCLYLGLTYFLQSKWNPAIKALTRALKIKAHASSCLFYRGLAYLEMGQEAEALKDAADLRATEGFVPYGAGIEAAVALVRGDAESATRLAGEALAGQPRMVEALVTRARAWAAQERWDQALDDYRSACALDVRRTPLLMPEIEQVKRRKTESSAPQTD